MTVPQHMDALARANQIRLARAQLKREINSLPRVEGRAMVADLLEHPPECCVKAAPMDLIGAVRRMGRYYALTMLRHAGVSESRRVGELTERQRLALASVLRGSDERVAA